ncbi:MAG: helix-turn-helix domain-containing protein [Treponema sp.]|jgi:transcriptional regulator with XRE-family HTH domain|nr:helix-turn-helix domain-containing protein [Treponema sp.]
MEKMKSILAKRVTAEEQALKDILSGNLKKYRHRRNWSQFTLAAKVDISTNFLADIEAGNTWVSAQTLVKFAKIFEIEVFELLKPQKEDKDPKTKKEIDNNKAVLNQFSQDLTVVLQESMEKALNHVKKQYKIG